MAVVKAAAATEVAVAEDQPPVLEYCGICFSSVEGPEEEQPPDQASQLPTHHVISAVASCNHKFHQSCLDRWRLVHVDGTCPQCRARLEPLQQGAGAAGAAEAPRPPPPRHALAPRLDASCCCGVCHTETLSSIGRRDLDLSLFAIKLHDNKRLAFTTAFGPMQPAVMLVWSGGVCHYTPSSCADALFAELRQHAIRGVDRGGGMTLAEAEEQVEDQLREAQSKKGGDLKKLLLASARGSSQNPPSIQLSEPHCHGVLSCVPA